MKLNVKTEARIDSTITITGEDILEILKSKCPEHFRGADSITVTFQVPYAADWDNTEINIDKDNPIIIKISKHEIR